MQNLHQRKELPVCVFVLQKKKELPLCVCYIGLFFSPFSVSIEVDRGGGRVGEDLQ